MNKSIEEIIKDRIKNKSGKDFQQLCWDILICIYPDLHTPKMQSDLGNDGYTIDGKIFFAMYSPESDKYDNKETSKKISNSNIEDLGDYEKFSKNWKDKFNFEKWVFLTRDNLMGKPNQKIVELNNISDGIKKEQWGLEQLLKLSINLDPKNQVRIFNLPSFADMYKSQSNEVETIIDLIEYISENAELVEDSFNNVVPDPENKIYIRFAKFCKEIKSEIQDYAMYACSQKEAENSIGLSIIDVAKIRGFLKTKSRKFLRDSNQKPILALDQLTEYFEEQLKINNANYDHNAIRYYLISEIPKCNVFPNDD
jgi:hypothetical protein